MRKIILTTTLAALCTLATASAAQTKHFNIPIKTQVHQVVNVTNLNNEQLEQIMLGKHPTIAVEFTQGMLLPINFLVDGNFIQLADGKYGVLEVQRTFYVRCTPKQILLSANLQQWKTPLEFLTGNFTANLTIDQGMAQVKIASEANQRS